MIQYESQGHNHMKDGSKKRWVYRTKSHTPHHAKLMAAYGGMILKTDTSVSSPFGVYSEVIEKWDCPLCKDVSFVHQTRLFNGEWETIMDDDDKPVVYSSRSIAKQAMNDHLGSLRDAFDKGYVTDYDPANWRIEKLS